MYQLFSFSRVTTRATAGATLLVLLVGFFLSAVPASASGFAALVTSKTGDGDLVLAPGERTTVSIEFENTGSTTWYNEGPGYVSIYTHDPKYRRSVFDPGTWEWGDHPARISPAAVSPGQRGRVTFELVAPQEEGRYEETFYLASEDTTWIEGGKVTFFIDVTADATTPAPAAAGETDGYGAALLLQSANSVSALAGRSVLMKAVFQNTGSKAWTSYGLVQPDVSLAASSSDFSHPSWQGTRLAYVAESIPPGGSAIVDFAFTAPATNGTHTARFQFSANDVAIPDAFVELPVDVTGGSGDLATAPVAESVDETILDNPAVYVEEPMLRIGLITVDEETNDEVVITSVHSDFNVTDTAGTLLATRAKNETVRAYYANGLYYYDAGQGLKSSTLPIRFEPKEDHAVMRIANFDRRLTRNAKYADNEFRGVLELRYNDYKDRTWVIEEIDMEYYLRGLAETSNSSHMEYQKALITAARSYAYYHYTHASKYKHEFFTMSSYSWDQVYNGFGQEARSPNIVKAVEDTRGVVVTHEGSPVFTPYFSRSDGRTRAFNEVWSGSYPWLVSVSVPWDVGRALWGHGVGLSAQAALDMANEDYEWDAILSYFYTGTEVTRKWN